MEIKTFDNIPVEKLPAEVRAAFNSGTYVRLRVEAQHSKDREQETKIPHEIFPSNKDKPEGLRSFEEVRAILDGMPKLTPISDFRENDLYDEFGVPG